MLEYFRLHNYLGNTEILQFNLQVEKIIKLREYLLIYVKTQLRIVLDRQRSSTFHLWQDVINIFTLCFSFFPNLLKLQNISNIPSMQLVLAKTVFWPLRTFHIAYEQGFNTSSRALENTPFWICFYSCSEDISGKTIRKCVMN